MSILQFKKRTPKEWRTEDLGNPWDEGRTPIFLVILNYLQLKEEDDFVELPSLPDQDLIETMGIDLAAGNIDSLLASQASRDEGLAETIYEALIKVLEIANEENSRRFYELISEDNTLSFIDELLGRFQHSEEINVDRLYLLALWLTLDAPDRGAVKTGIALLGLFQGEEGHTHLMILGSHDELTYFSLNALEMNCEEPERACFALAQQAQGWGRIHAIKRLAGTQDLAIKDWLLREGYRNDIAYEATAYECAKSGDLLGALKKSPDPLLLIAAGEIISALIQDPHSLEEYEDGDAVMSLYLDQLQNQTLEMKTFDVVNDIACYTKGKNQALHKKANALLAQCNWKEEIEKLAGSGEPLNFMRACQIAKNQGIDAWPFVFASQEKEEVPYWTFLVETDDPDRMLKVIQLAEAKLPLKEIASGAEDSLGLGPRYREHHSLECVLQSLSSFPGDGWPLLKAALHNPVVRLRRKAIYVLKDWGKDTWPDEADGILKQILEHDPTPEVREDIRTLFRETGAVGEN